MVKSKIALVNLTDKGFGDKAGYTVSLIFCYSRDSYINLDPVQLFKIIYIMLTVTVLLHTVYI